MSPLHEAARLRAEAAECRERIAESAALWDDDRRARELEAEAERLEQQSGGRSPTASARCGACGRTNVRTRLHCRVCRHPLSSPDPGPEWDEADEEADEGIAAYEAALEREGRAEDDLRLLDHARDLGYRSVEEMRRAEADMDDEEA